METAASAATRCGDSSTMNGQTSTPPTPGAGSPSEDTSSAQLTKVWVVIHDDGDRVTWARGVFTVEAQAAERANTDEPCGEEHEHYWDGTEGPLTAEQCIDAEVHTST